MADLTIDMPNGIKFRTASKRRYVVAVYRPGITKWTAEYRTDVESRAVAQWRHEARICDAANLIDTIERKVIR